MVEHDKTTPLGAITNPLATRSAPDTAGCAALYRAVAERLQNADPRLHQALHRAEGRSTGASRSSQGWILRYAFDDILRDPSVRTHTTHASSNEILQNCRQI